MSISKWLNDRDKELEGFPVGDPQTGEGDNIVKQDMTNEATATAEPLSSVLKRASASDAKTLSDQRAAEDQQKMDADIKAEAEKTIDERNHRDAIAIEAVRQARQHNPERAGMPWNGFEASLAIRVIAPALHAAAGRPLPGDVIRKTEDVVTGEKSDRRVDADVENGLMTSAASEK